MQMMLACGCEPPKDVEPDRSALVPLHAFVHTQDDVLVILERGIAFCHCVLLRHIAQSLLAQIDQFELGSFEIKILTRVRVDTISTLLGFLAAERSVHHAFMRYQT